MWFAMLRNIRKAAACVSSLLLSAGLCLGGVTVANATTRYAVSSGSWSEGDYTGTWEVSPTHSHVHSTALGTYSYCEVGQDGIFKEYMTVPPGRQCRVDVYGSSDARFDYAIYHRI
ncbi:hypothetical protein CLV65_0040 [Pseudoscardovia suis]|nr:hypothetical protein CLV65_0040 [Pseudoscardovia suis]